MIDLPDGVSSSSPISTKQNTGLVREIQMPMLYPGAFNATHKCVAGEGGRNVEDQDIFCFFLY